MASWLESPNSLRHSTSAAPGHFTSKLVSKMGPLGLDWAGLGWVLGWMWEKQKGSDVPSSIGMSNLNAQVVSVVAMAPGLVHSCLWNE